MHGRVKGSVPGQGDVPGLQIGSPSCFFSFVLTVLFSQVVNNLSNSYQQGENWPSSGLSHGQWTEAFGDSEYLTPRSSPGLITHLMGIKNCSGLNPTELFLLKDTARKQEKEGTWHSNHSNYFRCSTEVPLQDVQSPES